MNKPRAISAQLVDIRNLGTQKCVKMTIHVPQEQALELTKLFGWPTTTDPVPVALARLIEEPPAERPKREWHELKPSAQISIRCGETAFRAFLAETFPDAWSRLEDDWSPIEKAIVFVREHCGVTSRAYINLDNPQALDAWQRLEWDYRAWQQAPAAGAVA